MAVDWTARLAAASSLDALDRLVGDMQSAAQEEGGPFEASFCSVLLEASLSRLVEAGRRREPIDARRAAERVARRAVELCGTRFNAIDLDYAWVEQLALEGQTAEAERILTGTLALGEIPPLWKPLLFESHARLAHARGDVAEERARLERAEKAIDDVPEDADDRSTALCELELTRSEFALDLGLLDRASEQLDLVQLEPAYVAQPTLQMRVALTRCNLALALEDYGRIESLLDADWRARAERKDRTILSQGLLRLGIARSQAARESRSSPPEAEEVLRTALAMPETTPDDAVRARTHLADLALRRGDPAAAEAWLADDTRPVDAERATHRAALRVSAALALALPVAELSARADALHECLEAEIARLREMPASKRGLGFLQWGTHRLGFSEWARARIALDPSSSGVELALQPLLEVQALGALARSLGAQPNLESVRKSVAGDGRGAVVYLPSMDRSHVFCIDARGCSAWTIPSQDELWRLATALDAAWTTEPPRDAARLSARARELEAASREASSAFLPDELKARIANWSCCVVVGADLCGDVAFECLSLDGRGWLGLEKPIVYLSALPVGARLAEIQSACSARRGLDAVLVAAPEHGDVVREAYPEARPIALDGGRLERCAAAFERVERNIGRDASLSALARPAVRDAHVLTVLAHGAYDAERCGDLERPALLILAPDPTDSGLVCCADVETLRLPPYVELLACGAARGPLRLGDAAASHLVGACMAAGASTVLASRIDVGLDRSIDLAEALHQGLRGRGESPAEALLVARRKVAAQVGCADPWHWAGLTLHGAGWVPVFTRPPPRERSTTVVVATACIAIAVAASAALAVRRRARARAASS